MKKSNFKVVLVTVIALCVLVSLVNKKSILYVQNIVGIPGSHIEVGNSNIQKQDDWLLVDMQSENSERNWLYGMVPCIYFERCVTNGKSEEYFLFLDKVSGADIIFSASNPDFVKNLNLLLGESGSEAGWKVAEFNGYKSFILSKKHQDKEYTHIVIPELMLDIQLMASNIAELINAQNNIHFEPLSG